MDGTIGAYEAKTRLAELLDRVERGESLTITRKGKPVARLVPARDSPTREDVARALADIAALREELRSGGIRATREEIRAWIEEGRR